MNANFVLLENESQLNLLPFTLTRSAADLRIGIMTIREKWEKMLKTETSTLTEGYLARKFPIRKEEENVLINGSICPTEEIITAVKKLKRNQTVIHNDTINDSPIQTRAAIQAR